MRSRLALMTVAGLITVVACGDAPLGTLGNRSAGWINEPTVPSTAPRVVAPPRYVPANELAWANDEILNTQFDTTEGFLAEVFSRREGDRFVQASRIEIAYALPNVSFPAESPPGAEWVSSQLVFDNDGSLATDISAAFGIWSAEPYTRSRSVAQMIVFRIALDFDDVAEVDFDDAGSCARFADPTTTKCELVEEEDGSLTWVLSSSSGTTLVWFDSSYRYELFGRSFVSPSDLALMRANMIPLNSIELRAT